MSLRWLAYVVEIPGRRDYSLMKKGFPCKSMWMGYVRNGSVAFAVVLSLLVVNLLSVV